MADGLPAALLDAVVEPAHVRVLLTDRTGRLRWVSPALRPLLRSVRPIDLVHPDDRRAVAGAFRRLIAHRATTVDTTCRLLGPDGHDEVHVRMVDATADPEVDAVVVTVDYADQVAEAAALAYRADHDGLTGLANRGNLVRSLAAMRQAAVLFADLDGFKGVNDTLGHAVGDELLVAAAERLRRAVRPGDIVGRLGGDEFVVLAAGVDSDDVATEIALRVQVALSQPYHLAGRHLRVTASVGVALGDGRAGAAGLVARADAAMYLAKRSGGGRCQLHRPGMAGADQQHLAAAETLRQTLDHGEMVVAYAPVVDLADGRTVGRTAGLHLLDGRGLPVGRLADGSEVAEAAERSGLAVSVGAGLLDAACAEAAAHPQVGAVWVPVSARQLRQPRLGALVAGMLGRHHLEPARLLVEVDEQVVAAGGSVVWRSIADLHALGVGLGLSGFGSGGASPAVVRRAAPAIVVLDTTHVGPLGTDAGEPDVVAALAGLGRALGARPAAEGVATTEQADALRAAGCALACGPLWAGAPPATGSSGQAPAATTAPRPA
ncbi:MAG TPA: diguanylate cyclase [Acidimicrobiales bacterium]|nr:diguanylate cyclase [Acidimicrobiales bacterium]